MKELTKWFWSKVVRNTLKWKCRHFDGVSTIGCTGTFHYVQPVMTILSKWHFRFSEGINFLWSSDAIWRHRYGPTLAQASYIYMYIYIYVYIQSSTVIKRSNLSRYHIHSDNIGRKLIRYQNHNRHRIYRPHGRAMGCLLWGFGGKNWLRYNGTATNTDLASVTGLMTVIWNNFTRHTSATRH